MTRQWNCNHHLSGRAVLLEGEVNGQHITDVSHVPESCTQKCLVTMVLEVVLQFTQAKNSDLWKWATSFVFETPWVARYPDVSPFKQKCFCCRDFGFMQLCIVLLTYCKTKRAHSMSTVKTHPKSRVREKKRKGTKVPWETNAQRG